MNKPILNYNIALKSFDFDTEIIDELSLNSRSGKSPTFIGISIIAIPK